MTTKIYYCDRCGKEIHWPLTKPLNLFRRNRLFIRSCNNSEIDLCQQCCTELTEWYHAKRKK